ncbi:MAG: hypothetical protein KKH60_11355 [Proteobacteria bacterium]|nr:hypothetical protein [Pseudomonadota bacterium]
MGGVVLNVHADFEAVYGKKVEIRFAIFNFVSPVPYDIIEVGNFEVRKCSPSGWKKILAAAS